MQHGFAQQQAFALGNGAEAALHAGFVHRRIETYFAADGHGFEIFRIKFEAARDFCAQGRAAEGHRAGHGYARRQGPADIHLVGRVHGPAFFREKEQAVSAPFPAARHGRRDRYFGHGSSAEIAPTDRFAVLAVGIPAFLFVHAETQFQPFPAAGLFHRAFKMPVTDQAVDLPGDRNLVFRRGPGVSKRQKQQKKGEYKPVAHSAGTEHGCGHADSPEVEVG